MYRIEIDSKLSVDGFEHIIVKGISFSAGEPLGVAAKAIGDGLYRGHSVYERVPLEISSDKDFARDVTVHRTYHRFYRKLGQEFIKRIDRALTDRVMLGSE